MSHRIDRDQVMEITSPSNPRVKGIVALRRRRKRDESGETLVEGYDELDLALAAGVRPVTLYVCPELKTGGDPRNLVDRAVSVGSEIVRLSRSAFDKAAYRESPDGWLAVVPRVETALNVIDVGANPLVVVCGSVEKPGNLGSILRTSDAAGVTLVVSVDPVTDWGNPNVVRASKGTIFSVPVASCSWDELSVWLSEHSFRSVATTPDTDTLVTDVDLTGPTAILVGSEKYGLSQELLDSADVKAKFPMFGKVDSLNVGVAAAISIYESVRQRGTAR